MGSRHQVMFGYWSQMDPPWQGAKTIKERKKKLPKEPKVAAFSVD